MAAKLRLDRLAGKQRLDDLRPFARIDVERFGGGDQVAQPRSETLADVAGIEPDDIALGIAAQRLERRRGGGRGSR